MDETGFIKFGINYSDGGGQGVSVQVTMPDLVLHCLWRHQDDPEFVERELLTALANIAVADIEARQPTKQ